MARLYIARNLFQRLYAIRVLVLSPLWLLLS